MSQRVGAKRRPMTGSATFGTGIATEREVPDFASLHPGYLLEGADRGGIRRRHQGRSDADMVMERLPDPKGDRVKITLSGKFLPFKDEGATGNALAVGLKEE